MKRTLNFTSRNIKELIRDPLSSIFTLVLPLFLLWIFQQFNIPNEAYIISNFTPGIIVFGFSFITMFTAVLVSKDRSSSLLLRLSASPMKSYEYVLGYFLSSLPIAVIQIMLFILLAIILGLNFSINLILVLVVGVVVSLLFIAFGILLGSLVNDKSAPGVASVIVQLVAFTSGMWFSSDMVGGFFATLCKALPFKYCVDILKGLINKSYDGFLVAIIIFVAYLLVITLLSVIFFNKSLKSDKK